MLDIDRWSNGFQPFLTPRQIRIIATRLKGEDILEEDEAHMPKLLEWFESEMKEKENVYAL